MLDVVRAVLCVMLCGAAWAAHADGMRLLHSERSLYRDVLVYESGAQRCICFTRGCRIGRQSCMDTHAPDKLVMHYPRMVLAALYAQPAPRSALIVGLGGGTIPRALMQLFPDIEIDAVEIDAAVVRVARQYFHFRDGPDMRVHEMDGRVFVRRARRDQRRYDLIVLDAFDHEYIPEHLLTREFLLEVRSLLAPGGVLAANTFSGSRLYDHESTTYASVFPQFFNLRADNRVIIAKPDGLPSDAELKANSAKFEKAFERFGTGARELLPLLSRKQDWDSSARVLTDQYSPANLLNRHE